MGTATPLPEEIGDTIVELMRNPKVKRIKIYDSDGRVIFSTTTRQIGGDQEDNNGFVSAMSGHPAVELVYRDALNIFDDETEEDNLLQSYIPVRRKVTDPVLGVFEVYTDVNGLVANTERTEVRITMLTIVILVTLWAVLLAIVRRARDVIMQQQQTIREKSALLEELSRRSLHREDRERKKVAEDLHEGLAQTLSAIKLSMESSRSGSGKSSAAAMDTLSAMIPALHTAIGRVRAIATDLRPASLDELGLTVAITSLCRQFGEAHPGLHVEPHISVSDDRIATALRSVVYRNVQAALQIIDERYSLGNVRIDVVTRETLLVVEVEAHGAAAVRGVVAATPLQQNTLSPLSAVRERTIISGGHLAILDDDQERLVLHASWPLPAG